MMSRYIKAYIWFNESKNMLSLESEKRLQDNGVSRERMESLSTLRIGFPFNFIL